MSTIPPDLYPQVVAAIFKSGMTMFGTEADTNRYGWQVDFHDLSKERYENRVHIARLAQTSKAFNTAVNARLDRDAHKALSVFMHQALWSSQRFSLKSYDDRAEMHRLWWPEDWPYETKAQMSKRVTRYKEPSTNMLKLFVVWIHRRRDQLAVQVGIHEHEGPLRVFRITDYDPNQDVSDSELEDNASEAEQTEPAPPQPTWPQLAPPEPTPPEPDQAEDGNELDTDIVVQVAAVAFQENQSEQDESEDEDILVPITAITAIEDDIEAEQEEEEYHIDLAQANDDNDQPINLHYSASTPRWIDPDRNYEDVTTAELNERVGVWITQQHMKFFPCLVQYEPEIFSLIQ
jgi:hypothetical protein